MWISVARGLSAFEGDEDDFRGWVYTIARRRAVDWARRRQRQPATTTLEGVDLSDPLADGTSPDDVTSAREEALALLRRLRPDQREVVALRVIVGMSVAETASIVGKTEGAVRVLCHRGLRDLAGQLATEQLVVV